MKSILAVLVLVLVLSSSVFAAPRLPNYKELKSIDAALEGTGSVKKIIETIEQGIIDPMYELDVNVETKVSKSPGSSRMVTRLMERFSLDNPRGLEADNLKLLDLLVKRGLLINGTYGENGAWEKGNTLIDLASLECSIPLVDYLTSKGANIAQETFYWRNTFWKGFSYELGSENDLKCNQLTLLFLKPIQKLTLEESYLFLTGTFDIRFNNFLLGRGLDSALSAEVKEEVKNKFGIVLSKVPAGEKPSDEFFKNLESVFSQPTAGNDESGRLHYFHWWRGYTESEKAWACYASTFDEMYHVLIKFGFSHEDIATKKLLSNDRMTPVHGNFAVNIFVPYCDSIRN